MERELNGKDLLLSVKQVAKYGTKPLNKIQISGGMEDDKTVFIPRCTAALSDRYPFRSGLITVPSTEKYTRMKVARFIPTTGSGTLQAHHPLRVLIDPEREQDILQSFVLMAEQMEHFWMPTFPEIAGDSRRMNSNHGVASVLDAHRKGLDNFDLEKAYLAAKGAIMDKTLAPWSGKPAGELDQFYKEHGYIPALREGEEETIPEVHGFERRQPVAVTLGTSYDQWCLAQLAKELGLTDDYNYFMEASFNYRNLYNKETGFFHPKDKNGAFIQPFDYRYSGGMGARGYYGENNGWIYRWDVQHNIPDLIDLMGGKEQFVHNLDQMFVTPLGKSKYDFYSQLPDHTGNVGQFPWPMNPPCTSLTCIIMPVHPGRPRNESEP